MDEPLPAPDPPEDDPGPTRRPDAGGLLPTADVREAFSRLSRQAADRPDAHRAFVESKIGPIRTDPVLTAAQKDAAVADLLALLEGPPTGAGDGELTDA